MKIKSTVKRRKMKFLFIKAFLLSISIFIVSAATAQVTISVSGGSVSDDTGSLSYSVGQVIYTTVTGASGNLSQGVQQPYEISVVTGIKDVAGIHLGVSAWPNPAVDFLKLNIVAKDVQDIRHMEYRLCDMSGRLLHSEKIADMETTISMGHLLPAMYFVKVIRENEEVKTFKIIKK
jgi:hypothetical protein